MTKPTEPMTVLFDGECNMCSATVQFLVRHDPRGERFRFAAQQSDAGQKLLAAHGFRADSGTAETMVVITGDRVFTHSDAALTIARALPLPWSLAGIGAILPKPLRDAAYRLIARSRYKLFGRRSECLIPTPELRARFLS